MFPCFPPPSGGGSPRGFFPKVTMGKEGVSLFFYLFFGARKNYFFGAFIKLFNKMTFPFLIISFNKNVKTRLW